MPGAIFKFALTDKLTKARQFSESFFQQQENPLNALDKTLLQFSDAEQLRDFL